MTEINFFNPHQRCRYNDLPFATTNYFYTAGSRKGLEGVEDGGHVRVDDGHQVERPPFPLAEGGEQLLLERCDSLLPSGHVCGVVPASARECAAL